MQGEKFHSVKSVGIAQDRNARFRRTMEDAHVILDSFVGEKETGYFAIYDGHGGRGAVDFVAKALHENFAAAYKASPGKVAEAWVEAYKKTDAQIAENKILYSGTTTTTALVRKKDGERWLYCANVGDARTVLNRGGKAVRLTYEHKGSDEAEAKRIVKAGGFIVLNRVNGILAVTRSLGDCAMKDYVVGEPYTQEVKLEPTDTHLILACDGLWDVCTDQEAVELINGESDADAMAKKLLVHALKNGTTDNVSVMVVLL
jgi:protein phosphatase PTC1